MPWIPLAPTLGILGLLMAFGIYRYVVAQPAGGGVMIGSWAARFSARHGA